MILKLIIVDFFEIYVFLGPYEIAANHIGLLDDYEDSHL